MGVHILDNTQISGKGTISLGDRRFRIETRAEQDVPETRLFAFGETLRRWRLAGDIPVYLGDLDFYGQIGESFLRRIPAKELQRSTGRTLGSEIVEWVRDGERLAHLRLVCFPSKAHLDVREEDSGRVVFNAEGLETGWHARLSAGGFETRGTLVQNALQLTLETPGMVPGLVRLRLSEPRTGIALDLQAAWPAQFGMLLDPEGNRLARNRPISVEGLYGWRAVVPENTSGDLQFQLVGHQAISLSVAGEVSLASNMSLIRAMLAQEGPDAQINLCIVVSGKESHRLEIRRYRHGTVLEGSKLWMGLDRDVRNPPQTSLASALSSERCADLRATDIESLKQVGPIDTDASPDLSEVLGDTGGPWLIQSRLEGKVQRPAVWSPGLLQKGSREERIKSYAGQWRDLLTVPDNPEWERLLNLIAIASQDGEAAALDQVQALAEEPAAAIALAMRVPRENLSEVLELETAVPIFWPALTISDFTLGVKIDHARRQTKLVQFFEETEAETEADSALLRRVGEILTLRPELAGQFRKALMDFGLLHRIMDDCRLEEIPLSLLIPKPLRTLEEAAQDAARRFNRLPDGVSGLKPRNCPEELSIFSADVQSMIDAPLVAAEMATGLRPAPTVPEKLAFINLRLVDPLYFDNALPAAVKHYSLGTCT